MIRKIITFALVCIVSFSVAVACGAKVDAYKNGEITIGAMNGPTMMGLGELHANLNQHSKITITKESDASAIVAGLASGKYDAACLPANNAAILYNTKNLNIQVAAINTLNVLYLVQKAGTLPITSLNDLAGKTVYMPGQGTTPEYAFRHLLAKNNVSNVTLEFETEGSMIAGGIKDANSKYDYAVLPQPVATMATMGNNAAITALNLTDEWKKHHYENDIVTGVLVVRKAYLKNNKQTFDNFLEKYNQSVGFMTDTNNLDQSASYIVDMNIVPNIEMAKTALPKCGITYIEKQPMKAMLSSFYSVLHSQNANAIGGKLPKDNFYYI